MRIKLIPREFGQPVNPTTLVFVVVPWGMLIQWNYVLGILGLAIQFYGMYAMFTYKQIKVYL